MNSDQFGGNSDSPTNITNILGATPRSPLTTGLKRLHSESVITAPAPKFLRPSVETADDSTSAANSRERLLQLVCSDVWRLHSQHRRHLAELFFLQNNGAYLDFESWLASPQPQLAAYLQAHTLDISEILGGRPASATSSPSNWITSESSIDRETGPLSIGPTSPIHLGLSVTTESIFRRWTDDQSQPPPAVVSSPITTTSRANSSSSSTFLLETSFSTPSSEVLPVITLGPPIFSTTQSATSMGSSTASSSATRPLSSAPGRPPGTQRGPGRPPGKKKTDVNPSLVNGTTRINKVTVSDGRIEHAAKREAVVLRRIAELRRDGLWSADKLPRSMDPPRSKTHWDYMLEEMRWMANDFEQERKWKKASSRKWAIAAVRHKKEEEDKQKRMQSDQEKELRRIAAFIAKEVRQFWDDVERVVDYKANSILEAKRRRELDKHLDFIVGQTERYSNLVQEGLARQSTSAAEGKDDERGDSDFQVDESSEDDESTIDKDEKQIKKADVDKEVALLQRECDMELDDILDTLPPGYLESRRGSGSSSKAIPDDDESELTSSDESDREESEQGSGSLVQKLSSEVDFSKLQSDNSDIRQQELTHFAETAEKYQPTGHTLETARVATKVPFLLQHQLREYQHVGLDWLVTLYEKKLNGILADEMGLGKTIQTIALLAHLACEKGIWGPHLIVVPTTVMLNWEMELKKWCPGFKILTYYGSVKERKEKRHGWSKPNAFHVCITSYKLVLQDHLAFRRKKWVYLVLDEAQNIKNFKSQRWQMLLHFNAQRRLLLTGTPLQNSLMELWSLMHFLMPEIFASHRDFKDWFSNPVTDMIEGTREYNEQTIKRLHKVLRPFILRRLKAEVEKQLPKKYEHMVTCSLSKRQRYLYDDFMSRASTKDQLSMGNVMSVLNVLMQLRKVCNHPNLFESRPIESPFIMERLLLRTPHVLNKMAMEYSENPGVPHCFLLQRCRRDACIRCRQLAPDHRLIEELQDDNASDTRRPPAVAGFRFTPRKPSVTESLSRPTEAVPKRKNFQFVIPPQVAQQLDFSRPFMVQLQTASGPKMVPIQLRPPAAEALAKIGLKPQAPSPATSSASVPGPSNAPVQLPVWRLSQPSQYSAPTLQSPLSGIGIRASASRLAIVNYSPVPSGGTRPGFSVTLLRQPGPAQLRFGSESPFRTRTVLFRPAVSRTGASSSTGSPTVMRPQITVQEIRPRTPPTVRYVDPTRGGLASLPGSRPSTPAQSPAAAPATPVSPNLLATAASLLPSPGESASSEVDAAEKMDSSPRSAESTSELASSSRFSSSGVKRSASSSIGTESVSKRRRIEHRRNVLKMLATESERRNLFIPELGLELTEALDLGYRQNILTTRKSVLQLREELNPILSRFCIYTPAVLSGLPRSTCISDARIGELETAWPEINVPFKPIIDSQMLHFPELRLIEYDCGKLQMLNNLLKELKDGGHRCLIFTQMTKMLDILEAFLSYLGFKYLRLDGATKIENRQVLMERFNQDPRIFCLILSTRSGGLGVNLTGADTVIFYDSDWNPTMDAQAQDRCHRIGQTRDVHIYRLISEKTVEENILKKATQKKRLGELAIEEGSFTTEFFKKGNLKEIFDLSDDVAVREEGADVSPQELEQQMAALEDENDVQAARCARAEMSAELMEFDESQMGGVDDDIDPDVVEVEQKMKQVMSELKPVERYAVKFLERLHEPDRRDELQQTQDQMEQRKLQWELANQERLQREEQQRMRDEQEEFDLTYAYEDSLAQMFCPSEPLDTMPVWMPPTPPMSDSEFDPYVEETLGYLYSMEPMEESDLPPISGELDIFKTTSRNEPSTPVKTATPVTTTSLSSNSDIPAAVAETVANIRNSFNKTPKETQPRSLFEAGPSYRPKRDARRPLTPPSPACHAEQDQVDFPEWTVLEDYALLTAVTNGQQMLYSLASAHAGHTPNWDYVSKWVSAVVGHYCSPRACCNRYHYVILPREEGRLISIDPVTKKPRKMPLSQQELGTNLKKFRMRTGQQYQQEGSAIMTQKINQRFAAIRQTIAKRGINQRQRGLGLCGCVPASPVTRRDQDAYLRSFGIDIDRMLNPAQFAEMRDERLKELKKQHLLQQQQQQQQQAAMAFHGQQQQLTPVQVPFPSPMQQQQSLQQHLQPLHGLPQYSQTSGPSQGMMESSQQMAPRAPVPGGYGIASSAGGIHQHQMQMQMQQQSSQSQPDASQMSMAIHPGSRLMAGTHQMRPGSAGISSSPMPHTGSNMSQMLANAGPRVQPGIPGMGARPTMPAPAGVTTATVYRQMSGPGGLLRTQRTPPSTPAPPGMHLGTAVQVTPGAVHPRSPMVPSVTLGAMAMSGSSADSTTTSAMQPVVVQAPPTTVRFQTVSSAGGRPRVQLGSGGGFLVSSDVNRPQSMLSMPPMQMSGTAPGSSASNQGVSPISITGANAARASGMTPRHQVQLSQAGFSAAGKKNIALPRIATFTHGTNRGSASPVHLVASPSSGQRPAAQTMHGIRQAPSPSQLIRTSSMGGTTGRNIPSISMIMPPVGRIETIPGAGVTVTTTSAQLQQQHSGIVATSAPGIPAQGTPTTTQGYGAPTSIRSQQQ